MAPHRIDTHHHPYPPAYLAETADVLRRTTHAFYERLTRWEPAQAIEAMDGPASRPPCCRSPRRASGSAMPRRRALWPANATNIAR